jgi:XTP/dITP diphosphohydrolase
MDILFATSNDGKIKEFKKIFSGYQLSSLKDFNISDAEEIGTSFLENALIKAKHAAKYSNSFVIADDSGIVVPALNFEPGIFSARYAGKDANDEMNRQKIITNLSNLGLDSTPAYYVCVMVGLRSENDPLPLITNGFLHGEVSINESGNGGFGYDKIFYPHGFNCSMASLNETEKNLISHRGIASKEILEKLEHQLT